MRYYKEIKKFKYTCPVCASLIRGSIEINTDYTEKWTCSSCAKKSFYLRFIPKVKLINFMYYVKGTRI